MGRRVPGSRQCTTETTNQTGSAACAHELNDQPSTSHPMTRIAEPTSTPDETRSTAER